MTYDPSDVAAPVSANQHQRNMASASAAPLAAMGPGSVFGESVLGYADDAEVRSLCWQRQQGYMTLIHHWVWVHVCLQLCVSTRRKLAAGYAAVLGHLAPRHPQPGT